MTTTRNGTHDLWMPDVQRRTFNDTTVTADPSQACTALHITHGTCGTTEDGRPLWPAHNYTHPVSGTQLDRCRFCGVSRQETAA